MGQDRYSTGMLSTQSQFSFYKVWCGGLLSLQPYQCPVQGLQGTRGEDPCGLRSLGFFTIASWQDNTPNSYTLLPLNLSAAPTHHSTGMSYWWMHQSYELEYQSLTIYLKSFMWQVWTKKWKKNKNKTFSRNSATVFFRPDPFVILCYKECNALYSSLISQDAIPECSTEGINKIIWLLAVITEEISQALSYCIQRSR